MHRQVVEPSRQRLRVATIGMGWYPENQGNGLDRVFYSLIENQDCADLEFDPIVVGNTDSSSARIRFVDERRPLYLRMRGVAAAFDQARKGADLASAHFAPYAFAILRSIGHLPFVVHFHGPWGAESRMEGDARLLVAAKRWIEKRVYGRADRLIVLSSSFRDVLVRDYGVDADRVSIVPGGADVDRFAGAPGRTEARQKLGWPSDRPIVLSVRRLVRRVGLENLVDAVAIIRQSVPEVLVLIAGRGPLEAELTARIDDSGLGSNARLIGFVPEEDLPAAYSAADLTVVPTVDLEGFGLIAAESLAAGTPAIVTPVGGLPEVVRDLAPALVCDSSTPGALADRIASLILNRVRAPTRQECRQYARANYDWRTVVARTRAVYDLARS